MLWKEEYESKITTVECLLELIQPGSCVYVESGCGEPQHLTKHLILDNMHLSDVQVYTSVPLRSYSDYGGDYGSRFRIQSFFISPMLTTAFAEGQADHLPLSSSGMFKLFNEGYIRINTAIIQLSPPNQEGLLSLGVMVDIMRSIVGKAERVIAQVNRHMPITRGDSLISLSDIDHIVEHDEPLVTYSQEDPDPEILAVGRNVARLVEDGSTIQMGFGRIPDAALQFLQEKKALRIHSEIITDSIVDLADAGAIAPGPNAVEAGGAITSSLCIGSDKIFAYVHENQDVLLRDLSHISDPVNILSRARFIAINGAIEIDLTGQSCVGLGEPSSFFGALGHAVFNRTAMFSPGGKGIIALRSTSRDGRCSRIVPEFTDSRIGIITTQSDVNYVVTEFGSVNLFGKSIRERALALITIAHPKFRPWLMGEAKRKKYLYEDQALPPEEACYPSHHEQTRTFGDRDVHIRPIKVTDERAIQNLFYAMSKDDRFHRFLRHMASLHHRQAQYLVNVDYTRSMALIVQVLGDKQERIVAVAHIAPDDETFGRRVCEFAAMVDPAWQGMGIGTYLFEAMLAIGRRLAYETVRVIVWRENHSMLKVLEKMSYPMSRTLDCSAYQVEIGL
jgi:acyl-CoA hydrolase